MTLSTILHQSEWLRSKTPILAYAREDAYAGGSANLISCCGNQYPDFSGNWESIYLKTQQYHFWTYTQWKHTHTTGHLLNCVHNIIRNS